MLSNNIRLFTFNNYSVWRSYTYCHLKTYRNNYKQLVQAFNYSTKYEENAKNNIQSSVDPKIEALREKLLYCDYLDSNKMTSKYYLMWKNVIKNERKMCFNRLAYRPVYSVILNKENNNNDEKDNKSMQEKLTNQEENTRPVHMPYASTDQYDSVNASKTSDEFIYDERLVPLNPKYKILYDKYLAMKKSAVHEVQDLTLQEYLKKVDTTESYKTDLSNVPSNWLVDYEQYDDTVQDKTWLSNYGTPEPNSNISSVPCGGCGALLHCRDHAIPGYLPSELFLKVSKKQLRVMVCQRCHFMKHYNAMLEVKVSADEYPKLLQVIKKKKCAVILMVDLLDFPCSIWPDIKTVLHPMTAIFVVGNKIDLLPQDSPHFFTHVKNCLSTAVQNVGIAKEKIKHIELISAKTGYGIEKLINKLHTLWKYKGDVYVIGCTNVGKSTLFNTLLQSDYCKVQAVDLIQRATTSPWPGTTLNLLKFPILNPLKWRLYWRMMRLKSEQEEKAMDTKLRVEQFKITCDLKYATLQSRIGKTFLPKSKIIEKDDPFVEEKYTKQSFGFDETKEEYKHSRWCYDTPGTIQPDQTLDLLTTEELLTVLPQEIIRPRTFLLRGKQTIFLAGIGRLDYLEGNDFIRCTIFASKELPVTVTHTVDADDVYNELLETEAFVVPERNPNRLKFWPALGSEDMEVVGIGMDESVADVVLSSAGWVAITGKREERILLRAWSPQGRGLHLRTPALLRKSVNLRGPRVSGTPAYRSGRQVYIK